MSFRGRALVWGAASGEVLYSSIGLSFWGGVSPKTGMVVDRHHPLCGASVERKILAIPAGRGSCTGSQVILELLLSGKGPAAIILSQVDEIIALGAIVAEELFERKLPVLVLNDGFEELASWASASLNGQMLYRGGHAVAEAEEAEEAESQEALQLSEADLRMLSGARAERTALSIVVRMARLQGAKELVNVSQAHIDACTYIGPASLRFAEQLVEWDAKVRVPTTLNAISVDLSRLDEAGELGAAAASLAQAYLKMGAKGSFTCAPYLLDTAPNFGEHIGWGESNAVVFANSVLGARTQKYADFLDACVAITGRAAMAGCHVERTAGVLLRLQLDLGAVDDAFWPTLGYLCGLKAPRRIPAVLGLTLTPSTDDLKAFSAAFGTSSSAAMFHLVGITPEAPDLESVLHEDAEVIDLHHDDLLQAWKDLDADSCNEIDLVSLGNPHFSMEEHARMAELCKGKTKHPEVTVVITSGPQVLAESRRRGWGAALEAFGAQLVSDTCWCMLGEVVPAPSSLLPGRALITNSAKYAHYAPGLVKKKVRFGSLASCVDAACERRVKNSPPWLPGVRHSSTLVLGHKALSGIATMLRRLK